MIPFDELAAFALIGVFLALAPGPDNLFVLMQSALYGRKDGVLLVLGLCTGLVVHTLAVALGVAALLKTSEAAFAILKILGALYLLYLAYQAYQASTNGLRDGRHSPLSASQLYRRGIFMNLTNPKVSVFFLAFLPQFAHIEYGPASLQILLLGAILILVTFIVFSGIALLAGSFGELDQAKAASSDVYESHDSLDPVRAGVAPDTFGYGKLGNGFGIIRKTDKREATRKKCLKLGEEVVGEDVWVRRP
ncbi:LysE family translocator [Thiomicrorhabdus sp.]|uniref:LysE family translocator n=1 Tax=Thiomicrorhabdus sp. TaxID=2039724 RepID=UPI0029C95A14|nr:LysE family translocator [Thiomicrorhabdus sp.]